MKKFFGLILIIIGLVIGFACVSNEMAVMSIIGVVVTFIGLLMTWKAEK